MTEEKELEPIHVGHPKDIITAEYIAERLGVSPRTVAEKWLNEQPDFPKPFYLGGKSKRWYRGDIVDWLDGMRK